MTVVAIVAPQCKNVEEKAREREAVRQTNRDLLTDRHDMTKDRQIGRPKIRQRETARKREKKRERKKERKREREIQRER